MREGGVKVNNYAGCSLPANAGSNFLQPPMQLTIASRPTSYPVMCLTAHITASSIFVFANESSRLEPTEST